MCGKPPTMLGHLIKCDSVPREVQKKAEDEKAAKKNTSNSNGQTFTTDLPNRSSGPAASTSKSVPSEEPPAKRRRRDDVQQNLSIVASRRWTPGRQHDFSR